MFNEHSNGINRVNKTENLPLLPSSYIDQSKYKEKLCQKAKQYMFNSVICQRNGMTSSNDQIH
jgi:hypothetical protein